MQNEKKYLQLFLWNEYPKTLRKKGLIIELQTFIFYFSYYFSIIWQHTFLMHIKHLMLLHTFYLVVKMVKILYVFVI